ncbi:MAG: ribosomal protein S18-alanine N-acetyltransferase [Oscillospiraceae bacterium]|nr:ribosomal protein S18-alanine N-acetyltransferase [Oscillospiraceae bacterium]
MILPMNEGHVAFVAELERLCFSAPWSERSIASELNNEYSLWLVEEREGVAVAYVGSQSCPPEADVMNIAVSPDYRRQGIGEALMVALMDALLERGMESLTLEVRASNAPAIGLYTRLGFTEVGRRRNYYTDPQEDALIMRKELCHADPVY